MRTLLLVTALLEVGAGCALLAVPAHAVALLVGGTFDTLTALTAGRITGAALLALGVACWLARDDGASRAAAGLVAGMLVYNVGVVLALAWAGAVWHLDGLGIWPTVVLHSGMAVWCVRCLR